LPADEILALALAKAKKRRGRPPKRRKDDDAIPDEELAEILGGWVEVCDGGSVVSRLIISASGVPWRHIGYYFGARPINADVQDCVGAKQKRQILDKAVPGTKDLGLSERTTMICARCSINPACFVCKAEHVIPQIKSATPIPAESGDVSQLILSETTAKSDLNCPGGISDTINDVQRAENKDEIIDNNATTGLEPNVPDKSAGSFEAVANRSALTSELAAVAPSGDVVMASEETRSRQSQAESDSGAEVAEALLKDEKVDNVADPSSEPLLFRCMRCKRSAHYQHSKSPSPLLCLRRSAQSFQP
jgi:hypothetical protein